MTELRLVETKHPSPKPQARFDALVGLDEHKQRLLDELTLLLCPETFDAWARRHHPQGLPLSARLGGRTPLIVLSGEVGCGKSELALSVGTPLAERIQRRVLTLETPTDIRGSGLVGELSARVTAAFTMAREAIPKNGRALLVIDEADDLATSRAQMQAHHEDRAGLNVLVKQLNLLARDTPGLAVLLITNRVDVLDPAILRRAALRLRFGRPDALARRALFAALTEGLGLEDAELECLVRLSEHPEVPYSASDIVQRVAQEALRGAWHADEPLELRHFEQALHNTQPSPLVEGAQLGF